jgi:hypothetical protein
VFGVRGEIKAGGLLAVAFDGWSRQVFCVFSGWWIKSIKIDRRFRKWRAAPSQSTNSNDTINSQDNSQPNGMYVYYITGICKSRLV